MEGHEQLSPTERNIAFYLGLGRLFVSRLQELLKHSQLCNGWAAGVLHSPAAPDALASPLLGAKALFNLLCGPKEKHFCQLGVCWSPAALPQPSAEPGPNGAGIGTRGRNIQPQFALG